MADPALAWPGAVLLGAGLALRWTALDLWLARGTRPVARAGAGPA